MEYIEPIKIKLAVNVINIGVHFPIIIYIPKISPFYIIKIIIRSRTSIIKNQERVVINRFPPTHASVIYVQ